MLHLRGRRARSFAAATLAATVLVACGPATDAPEPTSSPSAPAGATDVGVQLFQWSWDAIGRECTDHLGPTGVDWVLTSPPQEHILGAEWWTAYQPVSYQVESRLGTREQFAAMVRTCGDAGVDVVADAVINHMTGQDKPGVGWAGSAYEHYEYPGLYSDADGDFHHCATLDGDIANYYSALEVQTCELVNLADLATETPEVRATIVAYLEDLLSLGVVGFRIDAAKHMAPDDVAAIVDALPADTVVVQEVIRGADEAVQPEQYLASGDVFEFAYGKEIIGYVEGSSFRKVLDLGTGGGYLPDESAHVFVDNHDTERNGSTLRYTDGRAYELATVLMLAGDYGMPVLYSGYAFSDRDAGPPQDDAGLVADATCSPDAGPDAAFDDGAWVCQHRWPGIAGMVQWRDAAAGGAVGHVQNEPRSTLAYARADRAFLVVNRDDEPVSGTWQTGLAEGEYCDLADGPQRDGDCAGASVAVAADGTTTLTLEPQSFVAIRVAP